MQPSNLTSTLRAVGFIKKERWRGTRPRSSTAWFGGCTQHGTIQQIWPPRHGSTDIFSSSQTLPPHCLQERCENCNAEKCCGRAGVGEGLPAATARQSKKWFHSERPFLLFIQSGKLVTGSREVMEGSNLHTQWETEFIEEIPPLSLPISWPHLLPVER